MWPAACLTSSRATPPAEFRVSSGCKLSSLSCKLVSLYTCTRLTEKISSMGSPLMLRRKPLSKALPCCSLCKCTTCKFKNFGDRSVKRVTSASDRNASSKIMRMPCCATEDNVAGSANTGAGRILQHVFNSLIHDLLHAATALRILVVQSPDFLERVSRKHLYGPLRMNHAPKPCGLTPGGEVGPLPLLPTSALQHYIHYIQYIM